MADTDKLITLYTRASQRLLQLIQILESGSYSRRRKEQIFRQIDDILSTLTNDAAQQAAVLMERSYTEGTKEAIEGMKAQGIIEERINPTLQPVIHQQAVQAIMDETFFRILEATDNMSLDTKRRVEEVVRTATERMLTEGVSRREATKEAVAKMTEQDITGIVAKNGARIPADKYMNGVVQYNLRKAHVTGAENMIVQNGYDLVYVNYVGITCEFCAKYQGRVYTISGSDPRFPKLELRPPYHAHCVHSLSAWIEEYHTDEEVKRMIEISNRPFTDNRTEANIRRYNELQREKARLNEDRKQWARYRAVMPDDTPKTLSAFRRLKNSANERWEFLQLDYRRRKRLVDNPKLALPNATAASAADEKFSKYLFNPDNPVGFAKGNAFTSRLGYNADNWKELQREITQRAGKYPATFKKSNDFGDLYEQKIVIYGKNNKPANVVVGWISGSNGTKMTSAYIKEVGMDAED